MKIPQFVSPHLTSGRRPGRSFCSGGVFQWGRSVRCIQSSCPPARLSPSGLRWSVPADRWQTSWTLCPGRHPPESYCGLCVQITAQLYTIHNYLGSRSAFLHSCLIPPHTQATYFEMASAVISAGWALSLRSNAVCMVSLLRNTSCLSHL